MFNRILKGIKTIDQLEEEQKMDEKEFTLKPVIDDVKTGVTADEISAQEKLDNVNSLLAKIIDREFVMTSPHDGSLISVVRTDEIIPLITEHLGIEDGKQTDYPEFFRGV